MPKFLFKANDDVISHCQCADEPITSTGQLDCPWCGCGWLMTCSKCRKAFTYAEVREIDTSLEELGRREVAALELKDITEDDITAWAEAMEDSIDHFEIGQTVVYLDGAYLAIDSENISFDGLFASHELDTLPHAEAIDHPERLKQILGDKSYWLDRELPERDLT